LLSLADKMNNYTVQQNKKQTTTHKQLQSDAQKGYFAYVLNIFSHELVLSAYHAAAIEKFGIYSDIHTICHKQ